jgi:hypothetical protein
VSILLLAGGIPIAAEQTKERHPGATVNTVDLELRPEAQVLANAKKEFRQGNIVRIVGGKPEDLQRLLGIAGASITPSKPRGNASSTLSESAVVYQLVAARACV